jgi:hypothetical protein
MARPTPPAKLEAAAERIRRHAGRLAGVRDELAGELTLDALRDRWEGACEEFLRHVGPSHRQRHLDVAHDRLSMLALALRGAAAENRAELAALSRLEGEVRAAHGRR